MRSRVGMLGVVSLTVALLAQADSVTAVVPSPVDNVYWLPWTGGESRIVNVGINSPPHSGPDAYAWDFDTTNNVDHWLVRSARGGVVIAVKDDFGPGGCDQAQVPFTNYVKIKHEDGRESLYAHLDQNSVDAAGVILGQWVLAYAPLGRTDSSGNVCSTSGTGDHLHYQVQGICSDAFCQSVPTSFQDAGVPATGATVTSGNHVPWTDLFLYRQANGAGELHAASGTGGWSLLGSDNFGTGWKVFRGYFNADALEDILLYNGAGGSGNTATMKVYFANGTGGWTLAYDSGGGFRNAWRVYPGDYGDASAAGTVGKPDGLTDLFLYDGGQPGQIAATGLLMYSTGTGGWIFGEANATFLPSWKVYPGEFGSTGAMRDGLTDLFLYNGVVATDLGNGVSTPSSVGGPVGGDCDKATGQVLFSDGNLDRFWGQGTPKTDFCRDFKVYPGDYGNRSVLNPGVADGLIDVFMYNGTGQGGKPRLGTDLLRDRGRRLDHGGLPALRRRLAGLRERLRRRRRQGGRPGGSVPLQRQGNLGHQRVGPHPVLQGGRDLELRHEELNLSGRLAGLPGDLRQRLRQAGRRDDRPVPLRPDEPDGVRLGGPGGHLRNRPRYLPLAVGYHDPDPDRLDGRPARLQLPIASKLR
jgi:murein DD-endopeptidase MepM/ murein hydrolase activator NlpD